jgi:tetratricopeptide (TPR) repeat protein
MVIGRACLVCLLLSVVVTLRSATAADTLLYKSTYEARLLHSTIDQINRDFFALFLAINSDSASYETRAFSLNAFYAYLDQKLSGAKSGKLKAKTIFREVHSYFFKQYEDNVMFDGIFRNGAYNCLTASMLYSLVLDRYSIPYEIKEKPSHVYLVSFPGTEDILFESTNPRGLYVPDEKAKREYVAGLVATKFVTQEYVNSIGVARAFNEFYYSNQNITLQQLAGLQYYNQALLFYEQKDIHGAIISALKADMLYPCTRNRYLKSALIREAISNTNFETLTDIVYLAEYANASPDVQDKRYVLSVFGDLLDLKLIEKGEDAFVTDAHNILATRVKDENLKSDIAYNYQLAMAHWYAMKGDMDEALTSAEKAHAINPNDARLQDLVFRAITFATEEIKGKEQAVERLQLYAEKFPFLKSNKRFRALTVYQYSLRAYGLFMQNLGTEGYKYLTLIEEELNSGGNAMIVEHLTGMAYAEAGAYHFRRKEFQKAKEILQKGLTFFPEHGEIKERLKITEDEEKAKKR